MARALPAGYRRRAFDTLPSTNGEALAAARVGDPGRLWITAQEQTQGRGRRGRTWTTGRGNLAASLLLIDPAPAALAPTLSFVAAVALHRATIDVAGPAKWPNDVLLDRHKVAGILIEGEVLASGRFAVVVGIGVNCATHPEATDTHAASDFRGRGVPMEAEALFEAVAVRLASEIETWDGGAGFAPTRRAWLARASGLGEVIRVNLGDRVIEGRCETLDQAGRLVVVRAGGGRVAVSAGEVFLVGAG